MNRSFFDTNTVLTMLIAGAGALFISTNTPFPMGLVLSMIWGLGVGVVMGLIAASKQNRL